MGLIGGIARTAVIAGTAQATANAVNRRRRAVTSQPRPSTSSSRLTRAAPDAHQTRHVASC